MFALNEIRANTRVFQRAVKSATAKHTTLNVERRFTPTKDSIACLVKNNNDVPFRKHRYVGRRIIKDVYLNNDDLPYDKPAPYLIRIRNQNFEAKEIIPGNYGGDAFTKSHGKAFVRKLVKPTIPEDLAPCDWMRTIREEWEVDGFTITLDQTLFGSWFYGEAVYPQKPFYIGRVGLSRQWDTENETKRVAECMDRRIESFVQRYLNVFPGADDKVDGKMEASKKWLRQHVQKLCTGVKTTDRLQMRGIYDEFTERGPHAT